MFESNEARELLARAQELGLVLPSKRAERTYAVPHFAFSPRDRIRPSGIHSLAVGTSDHQMRIVTMYVGTNPNLKDRVFLGGWERRGRAGAAVLLVEEKKFYAQDARGSDGVTYGGIGHFGQIGVTELDVFFPDKPLPDQMLEDPSILRLVAKAVIYRSRKNFGIDWLRYAHLPTTPESVRQAILRPYSVG